MTRRSKPPASLSLDTVLAVVERCAADLDLTRSQERQQLKALQQAVIMAHELGASYRTIGERAGVTHSHIGVLIRGR